MALTPASPSSVPAGIASTAEGPRGQAFNGLANSIGAGTKNPAASVKWVEYLASADCQDVDVSAVTTHVKDSTSFLFPITDISAKVYGLMGPAIDAVMSGKGRPSSLSEANEQVNALLKSATVSIACVPRASNSPAAPGPHPPYSHTEGQHS